MPDDRFVADDPSDMVRLVLPPGSSKPPEDDRSTQATSADAVQLNATSPVLDRL